MDKEEYEKLLEALKDPLYRKALASSMYDAYVEQRKRIKANRYDAILDAIKEKQLNNEDN